MTLTATSILEKARELQGEIVDLRRQIHKNPELSFQEHETAELAAEKLKSLGYTVKTGIGKTGVVGESGKGTTIGIRADMDGLPIQETNEVPYASKNASVMHACGHDAHVACVLATAKILAGEDLPGRIKFLMQPAEENGDEEGISGAKRMIEDGVMKDIDAIIGQHVDSSLPAGKVGIMDGPVMAAADIFKITVLGKGGHGAYPETTVDSIVIAAQIIQAAQHIVSRRISALVPAVVTVGSIKSSSTRGNVISDEVLLRGTIRSFDKLTRQTLIDELHKVCSIARNFGGDYNMEWELGYPPTVNNARISQIMREAAINLIGEENVLKIEPKVWSEDFSMLAEEAPGAFMFLGAEIEGDRRSHHRPKFDLNESGLYIGAAILAETARRLLSSTEKWQ